MLDFSNLSYNTEHPTFITILFTVICTFILSSLLAFTYEKTSRHVAPPIHYIQALILIAIVAATVMQAIGDSLARGLGMLGALSIIRFRTTLRDPRNITFMFASLAAGIACGVLGFVIAFTGTIGFCIVAFLLRFSPLSKKSTIVGNLSLDLPHGEEERETLLRILKVNCEKHLLKGYNLITTGKKEGWIHYDYQIVLAGEKEGRILINELQEMQGIKGLKMEFVDTTVTI